MNLLQKIFFTLAAMTALLTFNPSFALADAKSDIQCGANAAASGDCGQAPTGDLNTTIDKVVNLLSTIVGVIAVIMIIVGGLRYITSAGNPESAKTARRIIIYAVIGLAIAALARLIARFVLGEVTP